MTSTEKVLNIIIKIMQIETQLGSTAQEWHRLRTLTTANVGDVAEHLEVSVADSTLKWCSYLGKLMAVFYELNRQLSYAPSTLLT